MKKVLCLLVAFSLILALVPANGLSMIAFAEDAVVYVADSDSEATGEYNEYPGDTDLPLSEDPEEDAEEGGYADYLPEYPVAIAPAAGIQPFSLIDDDASLRAAVALGGTVVLDGDITLLGVINVTLPVEIVGNNFTITAASGQQHFYLLGGATTFTLDSVVLDGAGAGGGIRAYFPGDMTIIDSTFENIHGTAQFGGALRFSTGTLNITGSTFENNHATPGNAQGGALYATGTINISDSQFIGNSAGDQGGAILMNGGELNLTNVLISGNTAHARNGGGISVFSDTLPTEVNLNSGTVIDSNTAAGDGGGISVVQVNQDSTLNINAGAVISNNQAANGGGVRVGLWNGNSTLNLNGGQIVDNNATGAGGGVFVEEVTGSSSITNDFDFNGNDGFIQGNTSGTPEDGAETWNNWAPGTLITAVAIDVDAPATGAVPNTAATVVGSTEFTAGAVSWTPAHAQFAGDTPYTATVTLTAAPGYTFIGITVPTADINGSPATIVATTATTLTISFAFPPVPTVILNPAIADIHNNNLSQTVTALGTVPGFIDDVTYVIPANMAGYVTVTWSTLSNDVVITGTRPTADVPPVAGSFTVAVERGGQTGVFTVHVNLTTTYTRTVLFDPANAAISNTHLQQVVTVQGTAVSTISIDYTIPAFMANYVNVVWEAATPLTITITATRPATNIAPVIGSFDIAVTRGGVTESFTVSVNLTTTWVAPPPPPEREAPTGAAPSAARVTGVAVPAPQVAADRWLIASDVTALPRAADDSARSTHNGRLGVRGAAWASFSSAYTHDTTDARGVQVRISIDNPRAMSGDTLVSAWVQGSNVDSVRGTFERWFSNNVRVVHFDHTGAWGQTVRAAARVDLTGMNANNLYFYNYDRATNMFRLIAAPNYRIDANGYVHFNTDMGGSVIISDGPLVRR